MAQALEALTADSPLVLLFEDLQWSDFSTLELISAIARRTRAGATADNRHLPPSGYALGTHPLRTVKEELEVGSALRRTAASIVGSQECCRLPPKPVFE